MQGIGDDNPYGEEVDGDNPFGFIPQVLQLLVVGDSSVRCSCSFVEQWNGFTDAARSFKGKEDFSVVFNATLSRLWIHAHP